MKQAGKADRKDTQTDTSPEAGREGHTDTVRRGGIPWWGILETCVGDKAVTDNPPIHPSQEIPTLDPDVPLLSTWENRTTRNGWYASEYLRNWRKICLTKVSAVFLQAPLMSIDVG